MPHPITHCPHRAGIAAAGLVLIQALLAAAAHAGDPAAVQTRVVARPPGAGSFADAFAGPVRPVADEALGGIRARHVEGARPGDEHDRVGVILWDEAGSTRGPRTQRNRSSGTGNQQHHRLQLER